MAAIQLSLMTTAHSKTVCWIFTSLIKPLINVLRSTTAKAYFVFRATSEKQACSEFKRVSFMRRWQMDDGVDSHTLYIESLFSKAMHASMARIGWKMPLHKAVAQRKEWSSGGDIENGT
ncbi:hypothetical protein GGR50DRAFT_649637 [Xylaria sp. CBS 124048]|nr:hypothetical protein GGR50DRAFT_649637 [Xylaria sp. CBS 124048]